MNNNNSSKSRRKSRLDNNNSSSRVISSSNNNRRCPVPQTTAIWRGEGGPRPLLTGKHEEAVAAVAPLRRL